MHRSMKRTRPLAGVNGEVCEKVCKKKRKKVLTESALLEMDGLRVIRHVDYFRMACHWDAIVRGGRSRFHGFFDRVTTRTLIS